MVLSARRVLRLSSSALAMAFMLSGAPGAKAIAEQKTYAFNIPAESTAQALTDFSHQAGIQIVFPYDAVADHQAPAISGQLSRMSVLDLLLKGTNLEIARATDDVIVLRVKAIAVTEPTTEVVVTGTRIKGAAPTSPVRTLIRKDIDRSGYTQTGDLVRSLPENFNGGQNPGIQSTNSNYNNNLTGSSTVNLRGLGSDSTLTLLNGRRLAGDGFFSGPDISAIPLGAIQRVDIVTDGASALYGSDAVAGVVNFVLRKDFQGADLTASLGGASDGGGEQEAYSLLSGQAWRSGHIMASLAYQHEAPILASQRDYTSTAVPTNSLLEAQLQKSAFLNAEQDLGDRLSLHVDTLYAERHSGSDQQATATSTRYTLWQKAYDTMVNPGLSYRLSDGWTFDLDGSYARNANGLTQLNHTSGSLSQTQYLNATNALDGVVTGRAFSLPGGPVKLAFGASHREELYRDSANDHAKRQVNGVFAEAYASLIAPQSARLGLRAFNISLAIRSETYSDFGNTTNPKLGVRYKPTDDLVLRATWGKSFKAPSLYQISFPNYAFLYKTTQVGGQDATQLALFDFGGNTDLQPQRATSWTAGWDWTPAYFQGLKVSATYYHVDYVDRIVYPITVTGKALSDPQYAPFITLAPSEAMQAEVIASATRFANFSGLTYDPSRVSAYIFDRYTNASSQVADGVDVAVSKTFELGSRRLETFVNATWSKLDQQISDLAPSVRLSGTLFNPPSIRFRGGATWLDGPLSLTLIDNYVGAETDTALTPEAHIKPWSTLDVTASYTFDKMSGPLHAVTLSLAVSNLLDAAPPYAFGPSLNSPGVFFDSTNASAIGRYANVSLTKHF
ncbi:MAG: TonB-dependent receptor domain-containing protein [Asticcacaulis sp.]|uniref:TonB-dependent receptor domain-containing protein n=1 Tax=Asticcacaulis sp. TaxID=1872648 RepID=UPI003F7C2500